MQLHEKKERNPSMYSFIKHYTNGHGGWTLNIFDVWWFWMLTKWQYVQMSLLLDWNIRNTDKTDQIHQEVFNNPIYETLTSHLSRIFLPHASYLFSLYFALSFPLLLYVRFMFTSFIPVTADYTSKPKYWTWRVFHLKVK